MSEIEAYIFFQNNNYLEQILLLYGNKIEMQRSMSWNFFQQRPVYDIWYKSTFYLLYMNQDYTMYYVDLIESSRSILSPKPFSPYTCIYKCVVFLLTKFQNSDTNMKLLFNYNFEFFPSTYHMFLMTFCVDNRMRCSAVT